MNQPHFDVLEHVALPQVAEAVRARTDSVLAKWRNAVVKLMPQADELTRKQLDNSIPKLLHELSDALVANNPAPTRKLTKDAPAHGETRFHQHFDLNELLAEYHLLRRILLEEVSAELGRDLSLQEVIGLNSGVDITLREATVEFAAHQEQQITLQTETMSKYLSFLSHDLRGNLNGTVLTIELLRRQLANEPKFAQSVDDIEVVKRSIFETVSTMDRFLHAEQLRRGKMTFKPVQVEVATLFQQVIRNVHQQSAKPVPQIETDVTGAPQFVLSDREALISILSNLLSNAVKYAGGKSVRLQACSRPEGATRLSVIDSGPGIAAEKIPTLFQPFTRGETYGQKGVGLGLAIAQQTSELLGGKLHVESEVGKGCAFHVDLPASHAPA